MKNRKNAFLILAHVFDSLEEKYGFESYFHITI